MNREDVLDAATWAVTRAKKHLDYIEFSCEDASRSDWDYMVDVCSEVIRAGATVINLPDTTGHAIPEEFGRMFAYMREKVPGADKVIWSAHCHNDLGPGGREFAGGGAQRRASDRMHHQRHRRARGQQLDGRSRDGDEDAPRPDGRAVAREDAADLSGFAPAVAGYRPVGAGQQADRRRQCVRA